MPDAPVDKEDWSTDFLGTDPRTRASTAGDPPTQPGGAPGGGAPLPLAAAGVAPIIGPMAPPGVPPDPSIVDGSPWPSFSGDAVGGAGAGAGAGGGEVAGGAALGADATGAAVGASEALTVAGATTVAPAAAAGTGLGALGVGAVVGGVAFMAAAAVVGTEKIVGWALGPHDASGAQPEAPNDPDNPESGHGIGGAPAQHADGSNANPDAADGGAPEQVQAPSAPVPAPAADPTPTSPAQAPAQGPATPAVAPAADPAPESPIGDQATNIGTLQAASGGPAPPSSLPKKGDLIDVDPGKLHLPENRQSGPDPKKMLQTAQEHPDPTTAQPIDVSVDKNGELKVLNGVTRATRLYSKGLKVKARVIEVQPGADYSKLKTFAQM